MSGLFARITVDALLPGDVLLSFSATGTSGLVSLLDRSVWSHAALWTGNGVIESVPDGVVERSLAESTAAGERLWIAAYRLADRPADYHALDGVVAAARELRDRPYPLSDVLLMAFQINKHRKSWFWNREATARFRAELPGLLAKARALEELGPCRGLTCSELVATAYARAEHGRYALSLGPLEGELLRGSADVQADPSHDSTPAGDLAEWDELVRSCSRIVAAQQTFWRAQAATTDTARSAVAHGVEPLHMVTPRDLGSSPSLRRVGRVARPSLAPLAHASARPAPRPFAGPPAAAEPLPETWAPALSVPAPAAAHSEGVGAAARILYVAATSKAHARVGTDEEHAIIREALWSGTRRHELVLSQPVLHARGPDIAAALDREPAEVIHFAGHGDPQGLVLIGDDAPARVLGEGDFVAVLGSHAAGVKLLVLNACHTADLARRLAPRLPCVIAMGGAIRTREAHLFAAKLYRSLASGRSVAEAFGVARQGLSDDAAPILACREPAAGALCLAGPLAARSRRRQRMRRIALACATAALVTTGAAALGVVGPRSTSPPSPLVVVPAGVLHPGESEAESRRAHAACLRALGSDAAALCGASFDDSVYARRASMASGVPVQRFRMERHEVTNAQYARFLNEHADALRVERDPERLSELLLTYPSVVEGHEWLVPVGIAGESVETPDTAVSIVYGERGFVVVQGDEGLPVRMVSWQGARRYCAAHGRRLPTGAEWEWAARGPAKRMYPWGMEPKACEQVVYDRGPGRPCAPAPPGVARPSQVGRSEDVTPEGVHDLGGNVSEWVEDSYGDPQVKMVRGGHYRDPLPMLEAAHVFRAHRQEQHRMVGFRCVDSL